MAAMLGSAPAVSSALYQRAMLCRRSRVSVWVWFAGAGSMSMVCHHPSALMRSARMLSSPSLSGWLSCRAGCGDLSSLLVSGAVRGFVR